MIDLDALPAPLPLDSADLLGRAAAWPTRLSAPPPSPWPPSPWPGELRCPCGSVAALILPPDLLHLGHLAAHIAAPTLGWRAPIFPAPVTLNAPLAVRLVIIPAAAASLPSAGEIPHTALDLTAHCPPAAHPTHLVLALVNLLHHLAHAPSFTAHLDGLPAGAWPHSLTPCLPSVPTADNPAKQIAHRLHERLPLLWGSGAAAWVAADWALRHVRYAESMAWSSDLGDLARRHLLARYPRYWPNTVTWVQLQAAAPIPTDAEALAARVCDIARRRRIPQQHIVAPPALTPTTSLLYLLELGEWVALYSALLNDTDPATAVPHEILFGG